MRSVLFALILTALAPASRAVAALPFTADDASGARAQAAARKLPLFVEAWAPW